MREKVRRSRLLSLVLRHRPELAGIVLDEAGWTSVDDLLAGLARAGEPWSHRELEAIVSESDKRRFAFNADRSLIRANQGHSVPVDLGLPAAEPPEILYHGTAKRFLSAIMRQGLLKGKRHHVHLHADPDIAALVGKRRGEVVVLSIGAAAMSRQGFQFHLTENEVWLTESVPPEYIDSCPDVPAAVD